jgi:transcription elongation factor/antiterminator RfaH
MTSENDTRPLWYAIHTHPKQETRAAKNLAIGRVEILNPKIRVSRYHNYTFRVSYQIKPLFPSYIFGRFNSKEMLHKIRFTRGVRDVVSFGNCPTPIGDELIQIIQSRIGKDELVQPDEGFQKGDQVRIKGGPFRDLVGVFEWETNDAERVMILLRTISYQARTLVPKPMVEKAAMSGHKDH